MRCDYIFVWKNAGNCVENELESKSKCTIGGASDIVLFRNRVDISGGLDSLLEVKVWTFPSHRVDFVARNGEDRESPRFKTRPVRADASARMRIRPNMITCSLQTAEHLGSLYSFFPNQVQDQGESLRFSGFI